MRRVADEPEYLYELIRTIGAGPDLDTILRGVLHQVTEATACHACFIYFLEDDSLELREASRMYEHLEGHVRIPIGEGLTGWVAKTRRSAFIKEGALEDPRVRRAYFPELGDEVYESLVSVPIFARAGDVIGVITLHADAPHEFAPADLDFLEHTAALIAGAIENARLYEDATERVALLTDLSRLSQLIASAGNAGEVARIVADGTRSLMRAERCDVYLLEPDELLHPRATSPPRPDAVPVDIRAHWLSVLETGRGGTADPKGLADVLWGPDSGTGLFTPMVAGEERIGLLAVLEPSAHSGAETALETVAAHAAVAIRQHQVIEWLTERNLVKDFFVELSRTEADPDAVRGLADRLGWDLDAPHLVVNIVPWAGISAPGPKRTGRRAKPLSWPELAGQIEGRVTARFPGILVDDLERSIRALLPLGEQAPEETLDSIRQMDWGDPRASDALSVGVSNVCGGMASYGRGFDEAGSAAEIGALIRGAPGVTSYEDLGPYRYVLSSEDDLRDRFQQRLQRLVDYDGRRGTQLLDTLEGFLDHRGNVVGTSRALYIHPNTLRQRLDRIERVSGIDLERDDWLSLAVATKVVKLGRMRRSAAERGNDA